MLARKSPDVLRRADLSRPYNLVVVKEKYDGFACVDQLFNLGPVAAFSPGRKAIIASFPYSVRLIADHIRDREGIAYHDRKQQTLDLIHELKQCGL